MVDSDNAAPESKLPEFLTIDEWRRIVRVGRSKAYDAVRTGEVPHVRFGKIIRIPRTAIEVR